MIMDNFDSPFLYNRPSLDVEGVKKAINAALDAEDNAFKSDTEILLSQFNELLSIACVLDKEKPELDIEALRKLSSSLTSDKQF